MRTCGRCLQPIKRGEGYIEVVGIRVHLSCVREADEKVRRDRQSEPDGPVADSSDGYKVPNEMEEK